MQPGDALVIVDLDHFKHVNDRYGHQAGDETLRVLAHSLRDTARQVDCVARYGGEEFAVVLPEAGMDGAQAMLERCARAGTRSSRSPRSRPGSPIHEPGRRRAYAAARRRALYEAKDAGRDRDVFAAATGEVVLP